MCWRKSLRIWAVVMFVSLAWAGSARGEAILGLEHSAKKGEAKTKTAAFSVGKASTRKEPEFDRFASYLLSGKRQEPHVRVMESKKVVLPAIQENDKHGKKLKGLKIGAKPPRVIPPRAVSFAQPPLEPVIPMAASAVEIPASVPLPSGLWAGLGMLSVIGGWKWFIGRRVGLE